MKHSPMIVISSVEGASYLDHVHGSGDGFALCYGAPHSVYMVHHRILCRHLRMRALFNSVRPVLDFNPIPLQTLSPEPRLNHPYPN